MLRRVLLRTVILLALALLIACATPVLLGRTDPPAVPRQQAERAVARARSSGVRDWAPELLRRAETTLRLNLAEERLQSHRLLPLRDYRVARDGYGRAFAEASAAMVEATRRATSAKQVAAAELERAAGTIASAREVVDAVGPQVDLRSRLERARILEGEARRRFDQGDYRDAGERAQLAESHASEVLQRGTAMMGRYVDAGEVARWQLWIDETVRWSERTGEPAIVVSKDDHLLTLYVKGREVRSYPADIGLNNLNGKVRSGDHATPEGRYKVTSKRGPGQTAYYKALMLDYPNQEDRRRFEELRRKGEIPRGAAPGSLIEIHGEGGRAKDWTRGCVAVSNQHMDQLFARVRVGTPVTIVGGRGRGGVFSKLVQSHSGALSGGGDDTALD